MLLNHNELEEYLKNNVNAKNFHIFAALANLGDIDVYRKTIEGLYKKEISIADLASLDFIDEIGLNQLFTYKERFRSIVYSNARHTNVYDSLLALDGIKPLFDRYTTYRNNNFDKKDSIISMYLFQLDESLRPFHNLAQVELEFNDKVLVPLARNHNVNINTIQTLFPRVTYATKTSREVTFLNNIYNTLLGELYKKFTKTSLMEVYVYTPDKPSYIVDNVVMINSMLHLVPYTTIIETQFLNDIYQLSARSGRMVFNTNEIDTLWRELTESTIDINNISEFFSFVTYRITLINGLCTANNLNNLAKPTLLEDVQKIYTAIEKAMILYKEVESLISLNTRIPKVPY